MNMNPNLRNRLDGIHDERIAKRGKANTSPISNSHNMSHDHNTGSNKYDEIARNGARRRTAIATLDESLLPPDKEDETENSFGFPYP